MADEGCRAVGEFGVMAGGPGGIFGVEEVEEFAALDGFASGFYEEGAAAAGADDRVDFAEQIDGEEDVGAFCAVGGHCVPR
jgi:hypothetical protein